jgi:hypothetical protein
MHTIDETAAFDRWDRSIPSHGYLIFCYTKKKEKLDIFLRQSFPFPSFIVQEYVSLSHSTETQQ